MIFINVYKKAATECLQNTHTHTRIIHYSSTAIIQKKIPSSWSNLSEEENEEILCTKKITRF